LLFLDDALDVTALAKGAVVVAQVAVDLDSWFDRQMSACESVERKRSIGSRFTQIGCCPFTQKRRSERGNPEFDAESVLTPRITLLVLFSTATMHNHAARHGANENDERRPRHEYFHPR